MHMSENQMLTFPSWNWNRASFLDLSSLYNHAKVIVEIILGATKHIDENNSQLPQALWQGWREHPLPQAATASLAVLIST